MFNVGRMTDGRCSILIGGQFQPIFTGLTFFCNFTSSNVFNMHSFNYRQIILLLPALIFTQIVFTQTARIRIGTFDSRLVALAYYSSTDYEKFVADFEKQYSIASAKNDSATMKKYLIKSPLMQRMMHDRIFGKGTINDILDNYKEKVSAIGKANNVVMVVSKWEVEYKTPAVEFVDLTWKIMDIFGPVEQVIKWAKDGEKQPPIKDAMFEDIN
jgi:hypothetical protein